MHELKNLQRTKRCRDYRKKLQRKIKNYSYLHLNVFFNFDYLDYILIFLLFWSENTCWTPILIYYAATCNQFHNIVRLFDVLPNFPFSTSETMGDYYLQAWYIQVASRVSEQGKTLDLQNYGKSGKCLNFIEW